MRGIGYTYVDEIPARVHGAPVLPGDNVDPLYAWPGTHHSIGDVGTAGIMPQVDQGSIVEREIGFAGVVPEAVRPTPMLPLPWGDQGIVSGPDPVADGAGRIY